MASVSLPSLYDNDDKWDSPQTRKEGRKNGDAPIKRAMMYFNESAAETRVHVDARDLPGLLWGVPVLTATF